MIAITTLLAASLVAPGSAPAQDADTHLLQKHIVLSRDQLLRSGQTRLSDALARLVPALHVATFSSTEGSDHVLPFTAGGFNPDQLVVRVNGKRRHSSALMNLADAVGRGTLTTDLTMIPITAIDHVDITLGSGAGSLGSGAVAATIDIVLDKDTQHSRLNARYGLNSGELTGIPELARVDISGSEPNLIFAGDRNVDDGDGDEVWLAGSWGFALGDSGHLRISSDYRNQDPTNRAGFDDRQQYPLTTAGALDPREQFIDRLGAHAGRAESEQFNLVADAQLPLTQHWDAYGVLTIGGLNSTTRALFRRPLDIGTADNRFPDGFSPQITSNIDDRALVAGISGTRWNWDWDLNLGFGENEIDWRSANTLNLSLGSLSPSRFKIGNNEAREQHWMLTGKRTVQFVIPVDLTLGISRTAEEFESEQGDLASWIAGPETDPSGFPLPAGAQGFPGFPLFVSEDDRTSVALFSDARFALGPRLNAGVALRYEDFDDIAGQWNAQVSGTYQLNHAIALRTALTRGYKAPALGQRYYTHTRFAPDQSGTFTQFGIVPSVAPTAAVFGGQPLTEEKFLSAEFGINAVINDALTLDAGVYHTRITDQIVLSEALSGTVVQAALANAGFTDIGGLQFFLNGADTRTTGFNADARYRVNSPVGPIDLSAALHWHNTSITDQADDPDFLQAAGITRVSDVVLSQLSNGAPESKVILGADWHRGTLDVTLRATRFGSATDASRDFKTDPAWLFDMLLAYQAGAHSRLTLGVNNMLDEQPEVLPRTTVENRLFPYSAYSPYGTDGRFVFLQYAYMLN